MLWQEEVDKSQTTSYSIDFELRTKFSYPAATFQVNSSFKQQPQSKPYLLQIFCNVSLQTPDKNISQFAPGGYPTGRLHTGP